MPVSVRDIFPVEGGRPRLSWKDGHLDDLGEYIWKEGGGGGDGGGILRGVGWRECIRGCVFFEEC